MAVVTLQKLVVKQMMTLIVKLTRQSKVSVMPTQSKVSVMPTQSKASVMPTQSKVSVMPTQSKVSVMPTQSKANVMPTQSKVSVIPPPTLILVSSFSYYSFKYYMLCMWTDAAEVGVVVGVAIDEPIITQKYEVLLCSVCLEDR